MQRKPRPLSAKTKTTTTLNLIAVGVLLVTFVTLAIADGYFDSVPRTASLPCALRQYPTGSVCVCNVTYCDTLEFEDPSKLGEFLLVSSSRDGARFTQSRGRFVQVFTENVTFLPAVIAGPNRRLEKRSLRTVTIQLNRKKQYQRMVGFGGAFTGAVSHNLGLLKPELRKSIYRSYYSRQVGIGYNLMRIPIGGCDFDLKPWAYNELPEYDGTLSNFTELDERDLVKIEQIKELMEVTDNREIKFMGAAWSPPKWMKSNNDWTGASRLKSDYYQTWADYHIKYLQLMKEAGLDYWAISTGNEPMNAVIGFLFIRFMSLGWVAVDQGKWVGENLGPALRNSEFKNVKLFAGDDQRYTFPWWFSQMDQGHPNATKYVDGLAVHWYWDGVTPPALLDQAANLYPEKLIFNTEASLGDKPLQTHGPILGSWDRAESYIKYVMQDLRHSVHGWIDWNLLLNQMGGPNYASNFVETAVVVNETTGAELYKQPIFYGMGHYSRFITEGSIRFEVTSDDSGMLVVGFTRPDGRTVLVFYNKKSSPCELKIRDPERGLTSIMVQPKSVHSILYV